MVNFWDDPPEPEAAYELSLRSAAVAEDEDGSYRLLLQTSRGDLAGQLHVCEGGGSAAIFVGGASGGLMGPADGLYLRLSQDLLGRGISSVRLHYRRPGEFEECVLDVLAGVSFLKGIGAEQIALVGHSFGGAVVIKAGQLTPMVIAVAALSSQLYGADGVGELTPRALLLVHGLDDRILEAQASEIIYANARDPKQIVLYPGAGHALRECRHELHELLLGWLSGALAGEPHS